MGERLEVGDILPTDANMVGPSCHSEILNFETIAEVESLGSHLTCIFKGDLAERQREGV